MTGEHPGVAFVAGASRGLGLLIAHELGRRGFHVVIGARSQPSLDQAVADLRGAGIVADAVVCDVSDHDQVERTIAGIETDQGPIEVQICVAGVIQVGPLDSLDRSHFEQSLAIMLWGPINTTLAVLPGMRARGRGRIGIITSVGGLVSVPHLLAYSTAKFGAVGFSRGIASELAGTGVSVTTVAPGLMRTGSHRNAAFVGDHGKEYAWFATAASLPGISMDARRAAERIVDAVLARRSFLALTPLAQLGMRVNGVAPRLTAVAMALSARLLPAAPSPSATETLDGNAARRSLSTAARRRVDRLARWGEEAARRNNEL